MIEQRAIPERNFRLRWRFDFLDRPSKVGIFNAQGNESDSAWRVDKTNLVRASIEGENIHTQEVKTLIEVDGFNYAAMEWVVYSRLPGFYRYGGEITPRAYVAGLKIFSREHKATVFVDGTHIVEALTDDEKLFKKKEHSI